VLPESRPAQELFGSYDVRHEVSHARGLTNTALH
jgi:hypothetical protein